MLAHGYPWPDDSRSDDDLLGYATEAVQRWTPFAEAHQAIILSAPSTYPAPDPTSWPDGMTGAPNPAGWLTAATEVPVTVLVGDRDTEPRPPEPGQQGSTRAERAMAWVAAMHRHARAAGQASMVHLVAPNGLDHDEAAMALPAQEILARQWVPGWSGR